MTTRALCVVAVAGVVACGGSDKRVECVEDSNCDLTPGSKCLTTCSGAKWCAEPEQVTTECPSGFRWLKREHVAAGEGLAGLCVLPAHTCEADAGVTDAGVDDASVSDAAVNDAKVEVCVPGVVFEVGTSIGYMKADGSDYRALASQDRNSAPRWSPDGRQIVFVRRIDGVPDSSEVWIMEADGALQTQLTTAAGDDNGPTWSPDSSQIGFTTERLYAGSGSDVFVMDSDGTNQDFVDELAFAISWSPSGNRVAYATYKLGAFEVFSANPDGTGLTNLSNDAASDSSPQWSPDGTKIAFSTRRTGANEVFVMDANGSNQLSVTAGLEAVDFVWSPDGSKIAFRANTDIYVVDANGANRTNLTQSPEEEYSPTWSPDGSQLIFRRQLTSPTSQDDLFRINADGTGIVNLTNSVGSEREPHWSRCAAP